MLRETVAAAVGATFAAGLVLALTATSEAQGEAPPAAAARDPGPESVTSPPECGSQERALRDEVAALRRELAEAKLRGALAQGQLSSHEGVPQEWPPDAPQSLQPAAFRDEIEQRVRANESLALVDMDCSEFPCIAIVRNDAPTESASEWTAPVHEIIREIGREAYGDDVVTLAESAVRVVSGPSGDQHRQPGFVAITFVRSDERELKHRVQYRARSLAEEYYQ